MNRVALLVALGYVSLALVSAAIYVSATTKFVDYSETQLRLGTPVLENASVNPIPGGYEGVFRWRLDNHGRLPVTIAIFQFDLTVDNRSDPRSPFDRGKLADEYHFGGSVQLDRFTGPVVPPGGTWSKEWRLPVTSPAEVAKIVADTDGKFYLALIQGRLVYYVSDVDQFIVDDASPFVVGV